MPAIGLGTWLTVGDECTKMVHQALALGFRHIDTSENYANHDAIGKALAASSVPRSELFLADKISLPTSYSSKGVRFAVAKALASLGTHYLDLLMLHSPGPSRAARNEAWAEMVKLKEEGVVRAIGTSNFGTVCSAKTIPPPRPSVWNGKRCLLAAHHTYPESSHVSLTAVSPCACHCDGRRLRLSLW